jgi:hypothetical protein
MGVSGQRHALPRFTPPPPGKDPRYPLDKRLGGPQSRSGRRGQKKNPLPCRGSNPDRTARSQTLYCLSYRGSSLICNFINGRMYNVSPRGFCSEEPVLQRTSNYGKRMFLGPFVTKFCVDWMVVLKLLTS